MTKQQIEDLISSIAVRLEREFIFRDFDKGEDNSKNHVASDCFVTPPSKGEFYATRSAIYEVLSVTHVFDSSRNAGVIWVKKIKELDGL